MPTVMLMHFPVQEKAPAIIFIDELDAIGTKRFDSEKSGDREVQRTMLELLNQLDGFTANEDVKVLCQLVFVHESYSLRAPCSAHRCNQSD